jgi:hypothetical protein
MTRRVILAGMGLTKLEAGAALGAASIVLSGASLLASHAPAVGKVRDASPGGHTADELRVAELASGGMVLAAGATAAVLMRQAWPLLVATIAVGAALAVYEGLLHMPPRDAR